MCNFLLYKLSRKGVGLCVSRGAIVNPSPLAYSLDRRDRCPCRRGVRVGFLPLWAPQCPTNGNAV